MNIDSNRNPLKGLHLLNARLGTVRQTNQVEFEFNFNVITSHPWTNASTDLLGADAEALDVTHCNKVMLQQLFGCDPLSGIELKHLLQRVHRHQQILLFCLAVC